MNDDIQKLIDDTILKTIRKHIPDADLDTPEESPEDFINQRARHWMGEDIPKLDPADRLPTGDGLWSMVRNQKPAGPTSLQDQAQRWNDKK